MATIKEVFENGKNLQGPKRQDNLLKSQSPEWAIFIPSISSVYVRTASRKSWEGWHQRGETMKTLTPNDLNFLDPNNILFYWPFYLYSAGHAHLDIERYKEDESMVAMRDRDLTFGVHDSGGFQAATGVLNYPWKPKKIKGGVESQASLQKRRDDRRLEILRWLEYNGDYCQNFDFPTFAYQIPRARANGLQSYEDCFEGTKDNFKFFAKHRDPNNKSKFYTVLQGLNMGERDKWYEEFKDPIKYPFEAWSWAIAPSSDVYALLDRLIKMAREEQLTEQPLDKKPLYLHFLGNGKLTAAVAYTAIQKSLRKYINEETYITYDASSPYVTSARGEMYEGYFFDGGARAKAKRNMANESGKAVFMSGMIIDDKEKAGSTVPLDWTYTELYGNQQTASVENGRRKIYKSPIADYLTEGDICAFGNDEYGAKYRRSMDVLSYVFAMQHNTYVHCKAIQASNRLFEESDSQKVLEYFPHKLVKFGHRIHQDYLFNAEDHDMCIEHLKGADEDGYFDGGYVDAIFANLDTDIPELILKHFEKSLRDLCEMDFNDLMQAEILDGVDDPDMAMEKEAGRLQYDEELAGTIPGKVVLDLFENATTDVKSEQRKKKGVTKETAKIVNSGLFKF